MWKNLLNKTIRCIGTIFSPSGQKDETCWGVSGAIDVMMESRQKVKQKEQWMTQHLQKRALFQRLKNEKELGEE